MNYFNQGNPMFKQDVKSWAMCASLSILSCMAYAQQTPPQAPAQPAAQVPSQTPDALVRQVSGEVLDAARADKSIQSGDSKKISGLVETKVMPHVNFALMTSKAVGPKWNQATPEQKQKLQDEFRILLVRTYSGALAQVKDQSVQVKPLRDLSDPANVLVKSEIRGRGVPIQLDYRLEKSTGNWKIWDVNVSGLWLVTTYQGQFKPVLSASGIEGVIKLLTELNKTAAARG
jgi:phospholipid transport system substrate-binding protein